LLDAIYAPMEPELLAQALAEGEEIGLPLAIFAAF
jgi:hypothetical protein